MSIEQARQTPTLESIQYRKGSLRLLDQRKLPLESVYDEIYTVQDIFDAIKDMRVRGAPAIAVSAALGIAVAAQRQHIAGAFPNDDAAAVVRFLCESCDYVTTSRPTAVNLSKCLHRLKEAMRTRLPSLKAAAAAIDAFTALAEAVLAEDIALNEAILRHGVRHLLEQQQQQPPVNLPEGVEKKTKDKEKETDEAKKKERGLSIVTICNTGSLATSRYGTALGVVRGLFYGGHLERLYACETRPWNQGARLTVYECVQEGIPCTLICDSAAAALLQRTPIDAVIVGADRVCQNGDTANKIGTYHLAVAAKHHGVKFYVAAPSTTLDPNTADGAQVLIEEREPTEITTNMVTKERVVADGPNLKVWNPVFDITPGELITGGIITEKGVFEPASSAPYYDINAMLGTK